MTIFAELHGASDSAVWPSYHFKIA